MRRRLRAIAVLLCAGISLAAMLANLLSFLYIARWPFNRQHARWLLTFRGGVVRIDNQPQRSLEITETRDTDYHNRALWEAEHDRLRGEMERAPYGPEYTAARLRMDAWEKVHRIAWPKLHAVPTTPRIEHRLHLLWVVLLATVVAVALKLLDRNRMSLWKAAPRYLPLLFRLTALAACVALAAVWIQSYRKPLFFCIYAARSTYAVTVMRGNIALGKPQPTDPVKLAAAEAIADRVHNDDLMWLVDPNVFRRNRAPVAGVGLTTEVRRDTALEELAASPDEAETASAMLDALNDPERFLAAHAFLAELVSQQSFRRFSKQQQYPAGMSIGCTTYANSRYADLQIMLTAEQRAVKTTTHIPAPVIAPGQLPAIEKKWHATFDQWTKPHSLKYATPLLLFPLSSVYSIWRQRRRRGPTDCASCGYNLTGNTSGICPECGTGVTPSKKDAVPGVTV